MSSTGVQNTLASTFKSLHNPSSPLVLANVYDAASARVITALPNAKAIATASYAIAATYGLDDDDLTFEQNLTRITEIAAVVRPTGLPFTVDLQDGYEDIATSIRCIIELGVVGCNIEDSIPRGGGLRSVEESVARISIALETARLCGVPNFVINARTDALLPKHGSNLDDAIRRGKAFLEAGASTVFVWGGSERGVSLDEVKILVREFGGKLNVKVNLKPGFARIDEVKRLGMARISVGPELFLVAMDAYKKAAQELLV